MKNKKAEMGMGTLIIFIAMILVAAVAASVLVATTSRLQNKALDTGKLTTKEVGTGIQAIEMFATDGQDQDLESWYLSVSLAAGSDPMRFRDVLLSMGLSSTSEDYNYNSSIVCDTASTWTSSIYGYGVKYLLNGTTHLDGYLNKGDVAQLCFYSPNAVGEGASVKIQIVPKIGSTMLIDTHTPDLITKFRTQVYP